MRRTTRNPGTSTIEVSHGPPRRMRRGAVVVYAAFLMIMVFAALAFSVDVGYMLTVKTEIQRSVDSAALAGAGVLVQGQDAAEERAVEYLVRNPVGSRVAVDADMLAQKVAEFKLAHEDDYDIAIGHWNAETGDIDESTTLPSTIKVSFQLTDHPLFFAPLIGHDAFTVQAETVAMYQPRDIVLVLDLSGSMNDDSELKSIGTFTQEEIEANLLQCYVDLGEPNYGGVMEFEPKWIKVDGAPPQNGSQPQITVEYRYDAIHVSSTLDLSNVVLRFSNGSKQTFGSLSDNEGVFSGTGSNSGRRIDDVWVKSGDNASGDGPNYGEHFDFDSPVIDSTVEEALGLDSVAYPYPSGSWDDFIDYCQSSSNANGEAGYRYKFGYLNLINYWLEKRYKQSQTPDLWQCSAEPISSVKDSVDVFMGYIQEVDTEDRVGLAVYNATNGNGYLESALTTDLGVIADLSRHTQAGHYHNYTNIGGGMTTGRLELTGNARPNAFKVMVLMTDGQANWNNGQYNQSAARQHVLTEANLAKAAKIPIVTISLGANADAGLMQQVADITDGEHFNVPSGASVGAYRDALMEVFRKIADDRPLKIVK